MGRMVCIGTDLDTSRQAVELAAAHPQVWATVGLHPHDASRLAKEWDGLSELARAERVGGVGELNQADGIHPNAAGSQIVARNVWRVLEPVLRR